MLKVNDISLELGTAVLPHRERDRQTDKHGERDRQIKCRDRERDWLRDRQGDTSKERQTI